MNYTVSERRGGRTEVTFSLPLRNWREVEMSNQWLSLASYVDTLEESAGNQQRQEKSRIEDMSPVQIYMADLHEECEELRRELQEIKTMADSIKTYLAVSHCLLVVRKVGEDKLQQLKDLLD